MNLNLIFFVFGSVLLVLFIYIKIDESKAKKIEIIKKILFELVLEAERYYGSGTGKAKLNNVIKQFYNNVPPYLQKIVTLDKLEHLIELAVQEMKIYLEKNVVAKKLI